MRGSSTPPSALRLAARLLVLAILMAGFLAPVGPLAQERACAQVTDPGNRHGGVVIQYSAERTESHCIHVSTLDQPAPDGISGIEALERTEAPVTTKDFGGSLGLGVCKIGEVGTDDCSFQAGYWAFFVARDGQWVASETGAATTQLKADEVQAWVWTDASVTTPVAPSKAPAIGDICKPHSDEAVATTSKEPDDRGVAPIVWIGLGAAVVVAAASVLILRRRSRGERGG